MACEKRAASQIGCKTNKVCSACLFEENESLEETIGSRHLLRLIFGNGRRWRFFPKGTRSNSSVKRKQNTWHFFQVKVNRWNLDLSIIILTCFRSSKMAKICFFFCYNSFLTQSKTSIFHINGNEEKEKGANWANLWRRNHDPIGTKSIRGNHIQSLSKKRANEH